MHCIAGNFPKLATFNYSVLYMKLYLCIEERHHYTKIIVVRPSVRLSVCPLRKVTGNYLTLRLQRLYLGRWCVGS